MREKIAIIDIPRSDGDAYAIHNGVTVLSADLHSFSNFDKRLENIPAKDSYIYKGKDFVLAHDTENGGSQFCSGSPELASDEKTVLYRYEFETNVLKAVVIGSDILTHFFKKRRMKNEKP